MSVDGNLSNRINLPIAIMRSCYFANCDVRNRINSFADCDLCDRVIFSWSRVRTPAKQCDFFIGPGFDSQARSPVSGQCDSLPMSLAPTNGELG